jgi:hypothetical protein
MIVIKEYKDRVVDIPFITGSKPYIEMHKGSLYNLKVYNTFGREQIIWSFRNPSVVYAAHTLIETSTKNEIIKLDNWRFFSGINYQKFQITEELISKGTRLLQENISTILTFQNQMKITNLVWDVNFNNLVTVNNRANVYKAIGILIALDLVPEFKVEGKNIPGDMFWNYYFT